MTENIIEARLVILPGRVWQACLATELERLGVDPEKAPAAAAHALHQIVGQYGWLASSDRHEEPMGDIADERKPKRSYAASRRRESRIVDRAAPE